MENLKVLFDNIKSSVKRNKSIVYYISFFSIVSVFIFFFNSKNIFPQYTKLFNTPIGQEIDLGSTKLFIKRWEYNEDKKYMEVELYYAESDDSLGTKFEFSAKPEVNTQLKLPVKTVIYTDSTYIIRIENIPKDYVAISLKVTQDTSLNTSMSYVTNDDFDTSLTKQNNDSDTNTANLYCDYRKVKINNNLKGKSDNAYIMDITNSDIKTLKSNIIAIEKSIQSNKNLIDAINKKIFDLNSEIKYEIDSDQKKTIDTISSYNLRIQQINNANSDLSSQKITIQERIEKLHQKLRDLGEK
jgi:hypothetical protein